MGGMTHRERVMRALDHEEPDRVPVDFGGTRVTTIVFEAYERLKGYLGVDSETLFMDGRSGRVLPDRGILERFGVDTRALSVQLPIRSSARATLPDGYEDEWGAFWKLTSDGRYYVAKPPFAGEAGIGDLQRHRWPDPDGPEFKERVQQIGRWASELRGSSDCAILMELPGRVFSMGQFLCGFEDWLVNLVANQKFAEALLDVAVDVEVQMIADLLRAVGPNVDIVLCTDDLGMQDAPLISPALYRKVIKPRQRRLFDAIKGHTGARLMFHSDGAVWPFLGDLVDLGVDVLNPVQVSAAGMGDTGWLKREFGEHLAFWGAIDTQRVLPFGSPEDVRREVRRRIEDLASGGGYVVASVHNIQAEVPPENVCAMLEAAREFGEY